MAERRKNLAVVVLAGLFVYGFALWAALRSPDSLSVSERRPLAAVPTVSARSVVSGKFMRAFEDYAADQFPLRESFRRLKAMTAYYGFRQREVNGVYLHEGYAALRQAEADESSLRYALSRFRYVYDKYLAGTAGDVYFSIVPDKNLYLAPAAGVPSMDYAAFADAVRAGTEYAAYIDLFPRLTWSDYYRTDSHWKQENLPAVAAYLAGEMGVSLAAGYTPRTLDVPFYGVYYGQAALPLAPDAMTVLESPFLENVAVYDYESDGEIPVYDAEKAEGRDPYALFLGGSRSLLTLTNPAAATDRELVIFRDSYASSLAPLLSEGYKTVTLIDIRYISPDLLGRYVDFTGRDVLFLYSVPVLNSSAAIK